MSYIKDGTLMSCLTNRDGTLDTECEGDVFEYDVPLTPDELTLIRRHLGK